MGSNCQAKMSFQLLFSSLSFLFLPFAAFSQIPFYQGKTITVVWGSTAGGTGDLRLRAVVPVLQKHIPGNPTIIIEYMPGGGGRKAANHIYKVARPDGLTMANVPAGLAANAILGETGVLYDLDKLIYLGSADSATHYVFVTRRDAGLSNLAKLKAAPGVRIGAPNVGHTLYLFGRLFAYMLGMKEPKMVTGYPPAEIDLALMRDEVDARASIADTIIQRSPDWIDKGLADFHAIIEIPKANKHPRFAHLPELESLAKSERERKVLALIRTFRLTGSPFLLPPGTPKDRVQILQEAMRKAFRDPEFQSGFKRLIGDDPTPLMPEEQEKAIRELPREPEIIDFVKKLNGMGPLPAR